jgi:hypothetical protein
MRAKIFLLMEKTVDDAKGRLGLNDNDREVSL